MIEATNIYYFYRICAIGGIETFFYELAKKYQDYDIVFVCKYGDKAQIERLRKYVKVIIYTGQKIKCKRAFFNYNMDIIDNVEADDYYLVIHGDYKQLSGRIPRNEKITHVIGVSDVCSNSYEQITGIKAQTIYNPLSVEKPKKMLRLLSASRLNDGVKGHGRMETLARELDKYSEEHDMPYQWLIFTDNKGAIKSKNICYMEPRLNVRDYMASVDYVVQLSDNVEGYNYTINEALEIGTAVVATPCNVYKELGINDTMAHYINFDMSNTKDVVRRMFETRLEPKYHAPKDRWDELLIYKKSTYQEERNMKYEVEALNTYEKKKVVDSVLGRIPKEHERFIVTGDRLDVLLGTNQLGVAFVKVVREIKEPVMETAKVEPEAEKAVDKPTPKQKKKNG